MFKAFVTVFFLLLASPALAQTGGGILVIDGDVLVINGEYYRLWGIDAPELDQSCTLEDGKEWLCGLDAKDKLQELIANKWVNCEGRDLDPRGFIISSCFANGVNLSELMVASGMAVAYRQHTDLYMPIEAQARDQKIGLWKSKFQPPIEWRREHKRAY